MSLGTADRVKNLASGTVTRCKVSPFLVGMAARLMPAAGGAATVYRATHPGTNDTARYWRTKGDGSTVTFTAPAALTAFPSTVDASITDANRMQCVVLINGSPIVRKGSDASPSAGQFICASATTITFGSTYASGTVIEVFVLSASGDISNTGSIAAGAVLAETLQSFYTSSAPCALEAYAHP